MYRRVCVLVAAAWSSAGCSILRPQMIENLECKAPLKPAQLASVVRAQLEPFPTGAVQIGKRFYRPVDIPVLLDGQRFQRRLSQDLGAVRPL